MLAEINLSITSFINSKGKKWYSFKGILPKHGQCINSTTNVYPQRIIEILYNYKYKMIHDNLPVGSFLIHPDLQEIWNLIEI